jgi:hypothetical protein
MSQLCRVNQDPVEISDLLGVIEMEVVNKTNNQAFLAVVEISPASYLWPQSILTEREREGRRYHSLKRRGIVVYIEYLSVWTVVRIGSPPTPSPVRECCSPLFGSKGVGGDTILTKGKTLCYSMYNFLYIYYNPSAPKTVTKKYLLCPFPPYVF